MTTSASHPAGRPEKQLLRVGFNPLTDCASVVVAALLGFDERYGIKIALRREASWAGVRDKLIGELDAAHVLYGLVYGARRVGWQQKDMAVLMEPERPGDHPVAAPGRAGVVDGARWRRCARRAAHLTYAQTFPTGTHAMWLPTAGGAGPTRSATPASLACRRRRWWPTWRPVTWTAFAPASPGATAPCRPGRRHRRHQPAEPARPLERCWAPGRVRRTPPNACRA